MIQQGSYLEESFLATKNREELLFLRHVWWIHNRLIRVCQWMDPKLTGGDLGGITSLTWKLARATELFRFYFNETTTFSGSNFPFMLRLMAQRQ